jgi:DNA-binding protein HU-beta
MKKQGLVEAVMKAANIEIKKQAVSAVEAVFDTIVKTVGRGEEVAMPGFGKFYVRRTPARPARQVRNPATGEMMMAQPKPAMNKPKFRAGKMLKEAVK